MNNWLGTVLFGFFAVWVIFIVLSGMVLFTFLFVMMLITAIGAVI